MSPTTTLTAARSTSPTEAPALERAARAAETAARFADAVDEEQRFPAEALQAFRRERLLGLYVPRELGGDGLSLSELVEVGHVLGQACGSSAMIFAMHQVKAACLVRHAVSSPWHREFLSRCARDQLLLASSTTEGSRGGDVRASEAPIVIADGRLTLHRDASVMSYGQEADAVVTTARRSAESSSSDQVLVVFERRQTRLKRTREWRTLGMRGTGSAGFELRAEGDAAQVAPEPYADIHARTMTPAAHLLWSGVWLGVAADAVERARLQQRRSAMERQGAPPFGMGPFQAAARALRAGRGLLAASLDRFAPYDRDPRAVPSLELQTSLTLLKADVSELAVEAVLSALRANGLSGYRTDGPASLARHLRDILSAPIMISNERILANAGPSALLARTPRGVRSLAPGAC